MNTRFWVILITLMLLQAVMGYFGIMHLLPVSYSSLAKNTLSIGGEVFVSIVFIILITAINNVMMDYYNANLQLMGDRLKKLNDKMDREIDDVLKDSTEAVDGILRDFENVGDDGEGNIIANCKLCGANGVLLHEHKCK